MAVTLRSPRSWLDWLVAETDTYHLGLLRLLFCANIYHIGFSLNAGFVNLSLSKTLTADQLARLPLELGVPPALFRYLTPGAAFLYGHCSEIYSVARIAMLLAAFGICTRPTLVVAAITYYWRICLGVEYGCFPHQSAVAVVVLWVLALAPGVSSFSVDGVLVYLWRRWRTPASADPSTLWRQRRVSAWGARVLVWYLGIFYFASGFAKLHNGGLKWMDGQTLAVMLSDTIGRPAGEIPTDLAKPYRGGFSTSHGVREADKWRDGYGIESFVYDAGTNTQLGIAMSRSPLVCFFAAVGTIFFECGFLFVVWSRRLLQLWVVLALPFHMFIALTMGLSLHLHYWPVFLIAFDWNPFLDANLSAKARSAEY